MRLGTYIDTLELEIEELKSRIREHKNRIGEILQRTERQETVLNQIKALLSDKDYKKEDILRHLEDSNYIL